MGISLVTPGLPAGISSGTASQGSDSLAGGNFAELFSLQLVDLAQLLPTMQAATTNGKPTEKGEEPPADPALLLASMPPLADVMVRQSANQPELSKEKLSLELDPGNNTKSTLTALSQASQKGAPPLPNVTANTINPLAGKQEIAVAANIASSITTERDGLATTTMAPSAMPNTNGEAVRSDFANALATQVAHSDNSATSAIQSPLHGARWAQDFSEKVVWMARADQQSAQISINPPQLGPLQITLNMNGDQATAVFTSAHAEVRQAIEDAMPRLREMLAGAGIDLGQANVGSQQAQQQAGKQSASQDATRFDSDAAILGGDTGQAASSSVTALHSGRGLVDLFA